MAKNIATEGDGTKIKGWKQSLQPDQISPASKNGPKYLEDIHRIVDKYGVGDTYFFSSNTLDFEQYVVFVKETVLSVCLSMCAVFFVVLFITGSIPITILVVLAVALVDLFLLGLIYYWDLTMNNIIVVQLVIGLGLAVDYSAHIAHTYLVVVPPKELSTSAEKRMFKARVAVS